MRNAFEKFLNIDPNIIAEYLAKFLDFYLKKNTGSSNATMNDEKMEKLVMDTIDIFKYVNAKDIFEEFYLRGLARRLLLKKSASTEAEKIMISKLRIECSAEFGTKSDSMLKDLVESEHIMKKYRLIKGSEATDLESIETQFHVLSQGSWPIRQEVKDAILPPTIQAIEDDFKSHYTRWHQGKRLTFCPSMGTALVFARF